MSDIATVPDAAEWWDRRFALDRPRIRLFCFPFAGGSAAFYADWARYFVTGVELVPVQLPGRGALLARPPLHSVAAIADAAAAAIAATASVPAALYGHSMGAIVAFEVARRLQTCGCAPRHLFVSGRPGPRIQRPLRRVSDLPRAQFVTMLAGYGAADPEILGNRELLDLLLPMMRADFQAIEDYRYAPGPALRCPVTGWAGTDDPGVTAEWMRGWAEETAQPRGITELPGGHFFLREHAETICDGVHEALAGEGS